LASITVMVFGGIGFSRSMKGTAPYPDLWLKAFSRRKSGVNVGIGTGLAPDDHRLPFFGTSRKPSSSTSTRTRVHPSPGLAVGELDATSTLAPAVIYRTQSASPRFPT